jgi:pyridinium-3,5-bisthiocarboxylic acid mononucleotide nickel chelatase
MTVGHLLCDQGISGDLMLGALIDAGVPPGTVQDALDRLDPAGVSIDVERIREPVAATRVRVRVPDQRRTPALADAVRMLDESTLAGPLIERATAVMVALADAEANVHGVTRAQVRFHELGSLDTLADVVGVCAGLEWLEVDRLTHGVVNVGSGDIDSDHGTLSVPPPAVTELLAGRPVEVRGSRELTTPTGAAIVAALATPAVRLGPIRLRRTGRGTVRPSGSILTLLLGDALPEGSPDGSGAASAVVLEATMDDLEPQLVPVILDDLRAMGAMDVWATDIRMKKGRGGLTITVLCDAGLLHPLRDALIRHTPTLGARWYPVQRTELERDHVAVLVDGAQIRVKRGWLDGEVVNAHPEFDDVLAVAQESGTPVREVYLAAQRAASRLVGADTTHASIQSLVDGGATDDGERDQTPIQ